ncbi:hypothetical protein DFH08DRAFT_965896 [Mycena albidolilacea]|uniref:Fungal-type protein kinase domain-containing protein n=1 Tax=Mycena albidolilacea TaxID=1033008 RepID=A0AAD7EM35_9AGAR|nr:hypothetical protein DFH08DRAFT_965896 [Mycena albidolilacea]
MGLTKVPRAHIDLHLAQELHDRRSKSGDLVEALFGSLVNLHDANNILQELLQTDVLTAETQTDDTWKKVLSKEYQTACEHAEEYRWKWTMPVAVSEEGVAMFLNVVAIAAYAAAVQLGQANAPPCLWFITLPNPHAPVPLSHESATQDCRPDVVAVKSDMFHKAPTKENDTDAQPRFFQVLSCPFAYIRKHYPAILKQGKASDPHHNAIATFIKWFNEQAHRDHLDLWRFCWPELRLTAEGKLKKLHNAMLQELVYMRQHRRTQPWMRSVIGLAVTTDTIAVLRADTLGVEQCVFARESSRGVLDSICLCLGLVLLNGVQRGRHKAFQLAAVKTLGPPHVRSKVAQQPTSAPSRMKTTQPGTPTRAPRTRSTTQPAKGATPAPVSVAADVEYTHRTVRFIMLDGGDKIHYPKNFDIACIRYYVHYLVQDDGSLVGRCLRIFCVSREDEGTDAKTARFIRPYALKIYYADHGSECYRDDLIGEARREEVKNVLLPTWEWHYGDTLSMHSFGSDVLLQYTNGNAVVPNVVSNREEVFVQSDLKRVLVQCSGRKEFAKAFIDYTKAIASLEKKKLVHRDLSIGNVLLKGEPECPVEFWSEAAASAKAILNVNVTFTQRTRNIEEGGLLHDMDMAGHVHSPPPPTASNAGMATDLLGQFRALKLKSGPEAKELTGPLRGFRTGTPPFMAIELLKEGPPHLVVYDLHSLSFVMILFLWTYERFSDVRFPRQVPTKGRPWPHNVMQWANHPVDSTLVELAAQKAAFFSNSKKLSRTIYDTLKSDWWEQGDYVVFFAAMYKVLWARIEGHKPPKYTDWKDTTSAELKAALEKVLAEWEAAEGTPM